MNLQQRLELMIKLGEYIGENSPELQNITIQVYEKNPWFTPAFTGLSLKNIASEYLNGLKLESWVQKYQINAKNPEKTIGIVMAGNIPLVGFHDFLCAFLNGYCQKIKLSSKDDILLPFLISKIIEFQPEAEKYIEITDLLTKCDAYIATGSANSSRYFQEYFGKYPNIIRGNKTSVAVLTGTETVKELEDLSDDIHVYFGLGCRNITKLYLPSSFDFEALLAAFTKFKYFSDINKYRNNFDYQLTACLMNNKYYMTNGSTLLVEDTSVFSPISVVHYEFYSSEEFTIPESVQCIVGKKYTPFGQSQKPSLLDYADGVDTMAFLKNL